MSQRHYDQWKERGARASMRARRPGRFIDQHVSPLFFRQTDGSAAHIHKEISSEEEFWQQGGDAILSAVRLRGFRLSDWFPRVPGVYWSRRAIEARESIWAGPVNSDRELGLYYSPDSKMSLIEEGGIGTIRLRPRRIDGEDCWLATALTGDLCHSGVPLAIPYRVLRSASVEWGDQVVLDGRVRFLQDAGLDDTAARVHHARPLIVFVDSLRGFKARRSLRPSVITPVVLFEPIDSQEHDPRGRLHYTFVHCAEGQETEYDAAADWIEKYAKKHDGRVVTNFDEQRPMFADAPLSYQRLVTKTYERAVIEHLHFNGGKLADRIDQVVQEQNMSISVTLGDGTLIHGDFVVANSIRDSFNRVKESGASIEVKQALEALAADVGRLASQLQPPLAKQVADDLDMLTREATREKPRRRFWEVSIEGLKDAANAVREIGEPVLATIGKLVPLLAALS